MLSRLRRFLRRLCWTGVGCALVLAGVTWYLNARWLPTGGKALLAQRLGHALHASVTIDELVYDPWNGFVLRRVRAVDPATQQPTLVAPYIRAQIAWLPLLTARQARFRVSLDLEEPGPLHLLAVGRYDLTTQASEVTLTAREFDLTQLSAATRARLPGALEQAAGAVQLQLMHRPGQPASLHLVARLKTATWAAAPARISGRLDVDAAGPYLAWHTPPWQPSGTAQLHETVYAGLPIVQAARGVSGSLRFTPTALEAIDLAGTVLDIPLHVTGTVEHFAQPALALHVEAQPTMAQLTTLAPGLKAYRLDGATTLAMEITGAVQPPEALQVTAQGALHHVHMELPGWPRPLTDVNGPWRYTQATQTLTFERLTFLHDGVPATATGTLSQLADPTMHLAVTATAPLAQLTSLSPLFDAWDCRGDAAVNLSLDRAGAAAPLVVTAALMIHRGQVKTPWLPAVFNEVEGAVQFRDGAVIVEALYGTYGDRRYEFAGRIGNLQEPHLNVSVRTEELSMMLDAVLANEAITINRWQGQLRDRTRWQFTGQVTGYSRAPELRLQGGGTLDAEELAALPWPWAKRLSSWGVTGAARLTLDGRGPLRSWRDAEWQITLAAPLLTWQQVPLANVAAEARLSGGKLTVAELRASPAGGRLVGDGVLDFSTTPPSHTLHLQFTGVDLAQATQALPANQRIPSGTVDGQLALTSFGPPSTVRAQALVHARGDNLANVPFLNRVLGGLLATVAEAFKFGDLRQVTIQEVRGHLTIANEQISTEDLVLLGSNANFEVRGTAGFDRSLHLTIDPSLSKQLLSSSPAAGKLQEVVGQLDLLRIGRIEVTGTWEQPKFKARLLPLNELVGQFLPNLFNLLHRDQSE